MADTKVSALAALTGANAANGDLVSVVDVSDLSMAASGTNKQMDLDAWVIALQARGMNRVRRLASNHAISAAAGSGTEVTDLSMTVEAGTYTFEYTIIEQSATVTVAPKYGFNFTGTVTAANWWFQYADLSATLLAAIGTVAHDVSTATLGFQMAQAEDDEATTTGNMHPDATTNAVQTINTNMMVKITGLLVVSVAGDMELWHNSETATSTTVMAGSSLVVIRTA